MYPDWVNKFKEKGKQIRKIKENYYLYKVHSERCRDTKKIRKITDAYLGKITEAGLIPPKDKVTDPVEIKEYGIYAAQYAFCKHAINKYAETNKESYLQVMAHSMISFIHDCVDQRIFNRSFFSLKCDFQENLSATDQSSALRFNRMFATELERREINKIDFILEFMDFNIILVNGKVYVTEMSSNIFGIEKENLKWLR